MRYWFILAITVCLSVSCRCSNYTDPCNPNLCQNGAECSDGGGTATCNCTSGYIGSTCQTQVRLFLILSGGGGDFISSQLF